jgi:hypothetical protein
VLAGISLRWVAFCRVLGGHYRRPAAGVKRSGGPWPLCVGSWGRCDFPAVVVDRDADRVAHSRRWLLVLGWAETKRVEDEAGVAWRKDLLHKFGYKR